jgi:hypothetical protein
MGLSKSAQNRLGTVGFPSSKTTVEVCVGNRKLLPGLKRAALLGGTLALAMSAAPALAGAAAVTPTSLTDCGGHVTPDSGGKTKGEPNLLDYKFQCDGGITAYTILINQQGDRATGGSIDDYAPAPSVLESDGVTPSPKETLTCEGTTPSYGINCNAGAGAQLSDGFFAVGSVDPVQAYCKHLPITASGKPAKPGRAAVPQAIVQLVVTDYTGAEDGPFTLGSTKTCPKVPNVVPKVKTKPKKTKTKSKATSKKRS